MAKEKIMVVDDEEDVTFLLSSLLEFHDFSVKTYNDSKGVMTDLEGGSYRLIVTDYMMPGLDGLHLCEYIRASQKIKAVKIVMLTAKELTSQEHQKLLDLDVMIVKKPYQPNELVARIREIMQR
ncbi:MAG: response regulator [Deltaproteobacteria bacterium]|nr:response regulator [Deltaproteobacteria bacterium]